jgi:peptidyl-tRNA hydrolase, PTH1 family
MNEAPFYRIIVGLGNPGDQYARTRHNAGFTVIDHLADELGVHYWKKHLGAEVASLVYQGQEILLVKPQSFMNTSGGPVSKIMEERSAGVQDILVIHDDLDIPSGSIRLKRGGGSGGHNGLKSLVEKLGTSSFARVKFGIGRPPGRMDTADFVLAQLRGADLEEFDANAVKVAEVVRFTLDNGLDAAMQNYHASKDQDHEG